MQKVKESSTTNNHRGFLASSFEEAKENEDIRLKSLTKEKRSRFKSFDFIEISMDGSELSSKAKMEEHMIDENELSARLETKIDLRNPEKSFGLTVEEARKKLITNGKNLLTPPPHRSLFVKFLLQFVQFFPLLLEIGGVICFIGYILDRSTNDNLYLGCVLFIVVLVTACFSFAQEAKAESTMAGFASLIPQKCNVIREGKHYVIPVEELVIGDIVELKSGEKIPADLRILSSQELKVDNSSLTGENEPQIRSSQCTDVNPFETQNLAFFTSIVAEGTGIGVVVKTGDNTIIGQIAALSTKNTKKLLSPLTLEIRGFIRIVSIVAIALGIICFGLGFAFGLSVIPNLVFALGIIIANVPEGLLPTITVAMSLTAKRMAKRNILVKALESVETLGCCSVIASDKTGTLTQNKMTVSHLYYDGSIFGTDSLVTQGVYNVEHPSFRYLYTIGVLCNRAKFIQKEETTEEKRKNYADQLDESFDPKVEETLKKSASLGSFSEVSAGKKKKKPFFSKFLPFLRSKDEKNKSLRDVLMREEQEKEIIGDATETAFLKFFNPIYSAEKYQMKFPKIAEIPFNSRNKWQFSVHQIEKGKKSKKNKKSKKSTEGDFAFPTKNKSKDEVIDLNDISLIETEEDHDSKKKAKDDLLIVAAKGALEKILPKCSYLLYQGEEIEMTADHQKDIQEAYNKLAAKGERVLALAMKEEKEKDFSHEHSLTIDEKHDLPFDSSYIFVGLVSLIDPPKLTVPDAIQKCKTAGIRTVMVTGDHAATATSIARKIGIIEGTQLTVNEMAQMKGKNSWKEVNRDDEVQGLGLVVQGMEIDSLNDEDWDFICSRNNLVFARTSPEHKLLIVQNFQKRGFIVAVTGDGTNDSPALKQANLGCSMGITGTDAAKEAAHLILLDDDFSSIVNGIEEGRIVFDNLKKAIAYALSSNTPELLPFIAFVTAQIPLALSAILILFIDVGTDIVPAISLAYERPETNIMERRPRDTKKDRLVTIKLAVFAYIYLGIIQSVAGFLSFFVLMGDYGISPGELLRTSITYWKPNSPQFKQFSAADQINLVAEGQTAFFVALIIVRMAVILICKTRTRSLFRQGIFKNLVTDLALILELILALVIVYVPGLNTVLGTRPLNYKYWLIPLPFAAFLIAIEELRKLWIRKFPNGWVDKLSGF